MCMTATEAVCERFGGTYQGDDTSCEDVECPVPAMGACCFPRGRCAELTEARCERLGGTWAGAETTCDGEDVMCEVDCPCDLDADGVIARDDLFAFLRGFMGEEGFDFNDDGESNRADLMAFLECFFRGC